MFVDRTSGVVWFDVVWLSCCDSGSCLGGDCVPGQRDAAGLEVGRAGWVVGARIGRCCTCWPAIVVTGLFMVCPPGLAGRVARGTGDGGRSCAGRGAVSLAARM